MGQTINTMSSGELQRLKLAHFLSEKNEKSILIFDIINVSPQVLDL